MKQEMSRMIFRVIGSIALAVLLVSCGSAGAGSEGSDGDDNGDAGVFSATVTGDRTATIEGDGYFVCRSSPNEYEIASDLAFSNVVAIYIPNTTAEGVAVDLTAGVNSGNYVGASISTDYFDQVSSGSITLTAIPAAAGEHIVGSFSFTADKSGGETVTVSGSFDFPAFIGSFADCP